MSTIEAHAAPDQQFTQCPHCARNMHKTLIRGKSFWVCGNGHRTVR